MGGASIKMNEDGSFNLLVGATDIGTGADTMFCQIAAEALGVPLEKIIPYSSDTDMTPFDPGAYASSTTYISGRAVEKAARRCGSRSWRSPGGCSEEDPSDLVAHAGQVSRRDGRFVTYEQVALPSLYQKDQFQIMGTASHMSYDSPPPFAAVSRRSRSTPRPAGSAPALVVGGGLRAGGQPADGGRPGGGRGRAVDRLRAVRARCPSTRRGGCSPHFRDYTIATPDVPELVTILVPTHEPTGPFGAKAIAEIPINGPAPAIANAVFHATGVRIRELPLTPERVLRALGKI